MPPGKLPSWDLNSGHVVLKEKALNISSCSQLSNFVFIRLFWMFLRFSSEPQIKKKKKNKSLPPSLGSSDSLRKSQPTESKALWHPSLVVLYLGKRVVSGGPFMRTEEMKPPWCGWKLSRQSGQLSTVLAFRWPVFCSWNTEGGAHYFYKDHLLLFSC